MATPRPNKMAQTIKDILEKEKTTQQTGIPSPQETVILEDRATLLRVPGQRPLPPRSTVGRPSFLETLAHDMPDMYAEMINDIRLGTYWHLAAESIGINESTFKLWLQNGRKDVASETDSLYSRLYLDVRRASAQARAAIERAFAVVNPAKWLARGPGRIFGDHWSEPIVTHNGKIENTPDTQSQDTIGEVIGEEKQEVAQIENKADEYGMTVMHLTPEEELATLEAQESAGHVKVSEEYKESLRRQIHKKS